MYYPKQGTIVSKYMYTSTGHLWRLKEHWDLLTHCINTQTMNNLGSVTFCIVKSIITGGNAHE